MHVWVITASTIIVVAFGYAWLSTIAESIEVAAGEEERIDILRPHLMWTEGDAGSALIDILDCILAIKLIGGHRIYF